MEELTLKELKKYRFSAIIGIIIFTSLIIFQATVIIGPNDNCSSYTYTISQQEVTAFNERFLTYEETQSGSAVCNLIKKIISNASEFEGVSDRIPTVEYDISDESNTIIYDPSTPETISSYTQELTKLKEKIKLKKIHTVSFEYDSETRLINKIIINQSYVAPSIENTTDE